MAKRWLGRIWQLLLFPLVYLPYHWFNTRFLVKWFGCGCPVLDETGQLVANRFNANTVTSLFWLGITGAVIGISLYQARKFATWYGKTLYLLGMIGISLSLALVACWSMQWN